MSKDGLRFERIHSMYGVLLVTAIISLLLLPNFLCTSRKTADSIRQIMPITM